jgi:hypothetical protein
MEPLKVHYRAHKSPSNGPYLQPNQSNPRSPTYIFLLSTNLRLSLPSKDVVTNTLSVTEVQKDTRLSSWLRH